MSHFHFYSLRSDLIDVLDAVERASPLQYVRALNSAESRLETWTRGRDIPELGRADRDTGSTCRSVLVAPAGVQIVVRAVIGVDESTRSCVDQLENQDAVVLTPAGLWQDRILLSGRVATCSRSETAHQLMGRFRRAFRMSHSKIRAYYVGPQAMLFWKAGNRLTGSAQSPAEFDLAL